METVNRVETTHRGCKATQENRSSLAALINGTLDLTLTLGADDLGSMRTFIDVAYGVHPDFKSQTGGCVSFGTGSLINRATKQKGVTKSSTEAELMGASDYLPHTIWTQYFLEAQGYPLSNSYLEQDNESTIKLIKNGRASAGPRSRHINIRHFWITDRLKSDKITVRHCNTEAMLADFLTKPLQGSLFRKFRDVMLGYAHIDTLSLPPSPANPVVEERVDVRPQNGQNLVEGQTWADVARRRPKGLPSKTD